MSPKRTITRAGVALSLAVIAVTLGTATASAHVETDPGQAAPGDDAVITFRVPNEEPDAGVVKVEVTFPTDHPVPEARTTPIPGWTAQVTTAKLPKPVHQNNSDVTEAVRTITWTASPGIRIAPGEFLRFPVLAGPLPDNAGQLLLPAVQSYSNGDTVTWDAPPAAAGAVEPEHPAPRLTLVAEDKAVTASASVQAMVAPDETARWLGGGGLVIGILGLALGIAIAARNRKASGAP